MRVVKRLMLAVTNENSQAKGFLMINYEDFSLLNHSRELLVYPQRHHHDDDASTFSCFLSSRFKVFTRIAVERENGEFKNAFP